MTNSNLLQRSSWPCTLKHILFLFFLSKKGMNCILHFSNHWLKVMILLSYPLSDSSTFSHTASFSPCTTENMGFHSARLCSPFLHHLLLARLLGWCVAWGGGIVLACLALNSSKRFDSYKGSAGNPICFLTRETWFCVLVRDSASKAGVRGWDSEKLHRLCRRIILEKGALSNHVYRIIYRSAEW